ncbi:MAG: GNAT family N-acetyltransferase [Cyanomargarita calcarea GSE-NOS-MK-12-04C]|jgi:ribosomal-protein-alanine N-acetyltransferase|uniref:GNAT family N-acetyltransferase n=1 Tax=Cyanomargarita calcarea GSE-NOS-MK-12-04C TaxID=2839659 RepID=A0A951QQJ7_9CYAN|nr:GNAT family N-acetyltransferase [Cyanomargarita calcarea GSE-NOS-MK-12-04C]
MVMNWVFETQRLLLKPILESDLNALHYIFINPYVRKYLCDDNIFSLKQVEEMLVESQKLFNEKKFGLWFIHTKDEKEIIGFVGLWYFFDETQPQLVYALLPEATKKGYATEAAGKILEHCFDELGYQYLFASCDQPNLESKKVAERIGMREVEEKIVDGKPLLFFKVEGCRKSTV